MCIEKRKRFEHNSGPKRLVNLLELRTTGPLRRVGNPSTCNRIPTALLALSVTSAGPHAYLVLSCRECRYVKRAAGRRPPEDADIPTMLCSTSYAFLSTWVHDASYSSRLVL